MIQTKEKDMKRIEKEFYDQGYEMIAGIDEAGCGPLAGPVVACAVILPRDYFNPLIYDSKMLYPSTREKIFYEILNNAIDIGVGICSNEEIDKLNIRNATRKAMERTLEDIEIQPDVVLIDGNIFDTNYNMLNSNGKRVIFKNIVKGDRKSITIASASIVAKVLRDEIMSEYEKLYPNFKFSKHKGYPTKEHLQELRKFGPTEIHRKTFKPVNQIRIDEVLLKLF